MSDLAISGLTLLGMTILLVILVAILQGKDDESSTDNKSVDEPIVDKSTINDMRQEIIDILDDAPNTILTRELFEAMGSRNWRKEIMKILREVEGPIKDRIMKVLRRKDV